MSTHDAQRVFERQLQRLQLEEQAATSDYNAHLYNRDDDAAGEAMMLVAEARDRARRPLCSSIGLSLSGASIEPPMSRKSSAQPANLTRWTNRTWRTS